MTGTIYFIESCGRIKIGFSKNVTRRIRALACASAHPIVVLATIDGTVKLEQAIHRQLESHRAQLEWFYDCPQVRSLIEAVVALGGESIGFREPPPRQYQPRVARIYKRDYGRYSEMLRSLAEPIVFGDRIKDVIARAAERAGLHYWRAFDIYYGKARRIEMEEINKIINATAQIKIAA